MPGNPYKKNEGTTPLAKGTGKPKKRSAQVAGKLSVKAPTKGVSPGTKGGNMQGLIGQPSVKKTPHITGRHQIPKAKVPKKTGVPSGRPRK
jgi:hypothetical protein